MFRVTFTHHVIPMQYLIMHGSYGSPEENWFRWLERKLILDGHTVILEQFPCDNWDEINAIGPEKISAYTPNESLNSWEAFFVANILQKIQKTPTVFVGHSIAPIFMLHMLQKFDFHLERAIFVSPFFDIPDRPEIWQFFPVNKTFYSYQFNFEKIKKQIGTSFVIYGDDDPYVPPSEPPLFAEKLHGKIHIVQGGKHCGSNFKEFPLVYDVANVRI